MQLSGDGGGDKGWAEPWSSAGFGLMRRETADGGAAWLTFGDGTLTIISICKLRACVCVLTSFTVRPPIVLQ